MRRVILSVLLAAMLAPAALEAGSVGAEENADEIRKIIETAYVKGIHTDWDVELLKAGFHPEFTMFIYESGGIRKLTIDEWSASIEKKRAENPEGPDYEITSEIPMVDVTGRAAVARVELYKDGKHIFTDYMSLYRFDDGWKIVGKIYNKHE